MARMLFQLAKGEVRVKILKEEASAVRLSHEDVVLVKEKLMELYKSGSRRDLIRSYHVCSVCDERILLPDGSAVLEGDVVVLCGGKSFIFSTYWFHAGVHGDVFVDADVYSKLKDGLFL